MFVLLSDELHKLCI